MKKFLSIIVIILAVSMVMMLPSTKDLVFCYKKISEANEVTSSESVKSALNLQAKSSVLIDAKSGKIMYSDNAETHLAPASMTKVITLLLVMEEIDKGNLSLNQQVLISEYSASQEGSECFLDANQNYSVQELIKSVAVASANDSCVALAECISGDEKLFVKKMNEKAQQLGMTNTNFVNCTGLDTAGHYSCAKDLCIALKALSKYNLISELEKTWMYDMQHANGRVTSLTNTNRLIRTNPDIYMAKTGHTDDAGYCIVGFGKRNNMELIACVMGLNDSKVRFDEETKLLNYGFTNFESKLVIAKDTPVEAIAIKNGKQKQVGVVAKDDVYMLVNKNEQLPVTENKTELTFTKLDAPISKSTVVGKLSVIVNGVEVGSTELVTSSDIEKNNYKDLVLQLLG